MSVRYSRVATIYLLQQDSINEGLTNSRPERSLVVPHTPAVTWVGVCVSPAGAVTGTDRHSPPSARISGGHQPGGRLAANHFESAGLPLAGHSTTLDSGGFGVRRGIRRDQRYRRPAGRYRRCARTWAG